MKRSLTHFFLLGGFLFFLSSCQNIYSPTLVNQPLVHDSGQIQVSGHAGSNGVDVQGAGSPADNILLMINYNSYTPEGEDTLKKPISEQSVLEFGAGYYKPIGDDDKAVVEIIGGYGNGSFNDPYPDKESVGNVNFQPRGYPVVSGSYHKFFLQPGIGFHDDIFDAGFSSRVSIIDHYDLEEWTNGSKRKVAYETGGDIFWEPAVTGRIGYKLVKFQTQIGLSIPVHGNPGYWSTPIWFSIGLHVDIEPDYF